MQIAITFESLEELRAKLPELNAIAGIKVCSGSCGCKHDKPKTDQNGERFAFQRDESHGMPEPIAVREELQSAFAPPQAPTMSAEAAAQNAKDSPFAPAFPAPATAPSGDFAEALTIDEGYRLIVKAKLAAANKAAGRNIAREIIQSLTGCDRLTEVPLDKLPAIMQAAGEREAALTGSKPADTATTFTAARQY